jgi:hypothetical protein
MKTRVEFVFPGKKKFGAARGGVCLKTALSSSVIHQFIYLRALSTVQFS